MEDKTISTIELEIKVQTMGMNKGELMDAIATNSKLTKADAGRAFNGTIEDTLTLRVEPTTNAAGGCGIPKVEATYHGKGTQIVSG